MTFERDEKTQTVDLHVHSSGSDGTDAPDELLDKAVAAGLKILAVTDHDNLTGTEAVAEAASRHSDLEDFAFVRGVELSSRVALSSGEEKACHLLGYGFDPAEPSIKEAVEELKQRRRNSVNFRLEILKERFGIELTDAEKETLFANKSPGRPHIAGILMDRGMVRSTKEAFEKYLKNELSYVPIDVSRIEAEKAIPAIRAAGGIAVWAHPLGGEGERHLSEEEFEERLEKLTALGLQGLECYYSRYSEEEIELLKKAAQKNNLLISGGSDYHGLKKDIALGELRADGLLVAPEELTVLTELLKR